MFNAVNSAVFEAINKDQLASFFLNLFELEKCAQKRQVVEVRNLFLRLFRL